MSLNLGLAELFTTLTYAVVLATGFFILDDLFIDIVAVVKKIKPREISLAVLERMKRTPEKHIAVMIPNWKEADVIGPMVRGNLRSIAYSNYKFFLGVYPNDSATREAASRLEKQFPDKVVVVVNSQNGPTSKGQMLNETVRKVLAAEDRSRKRTDLFLLQNSDDVLHPQALTLLNYYSAEADLLQIPVLSFDVPMSSLVGGVYIDEFSETHIKELLVRQKLGAAIPSVGAGTCVSREFVVDLMLRQDGLFLKEDTLTEGYDLGLMVKPLGYRSQYICAELHYQNGRREFVATREYFPLRFMASVYQKSRWTLGIAYQGSQNLQWQGDLVDRYFLMRDRRGPVCSLVTVLAFFIFIGMLGMYLRHIPFSAKLQNPIFVFLVIFNALAIVLRILQRMSAVKRVSGVSQAALVPFRWLIANIVNACANYRAHRTYHESLRTGRQPVWIKTEHQLPAEFGSEAEAPYP